jgi:DNA helicase-2/ATP-dependent DNA helicase PcrA
MDKFYRKRIKIFGGPGCGKTTKLLDILKHQFNGGLDHDQVALVAFARATVVHLKERCKDKLNFSDDQQEAIKTIHSYCRERLQDWDVFTANHKREFKKKIKIDPENWAKINTNLDDTEDKEEFAVWTEEEDKKLGLIIQLIGLARHNMSSDLKGLINYYNLNQTHGFDKIREDEIRNYYHLYTKFKKQKNLIDFEDMLHKALHPDIIFPSYKILMVDECQDLSRLEWKVVAKLAKKSEEFYMAGDDDQAIYHWKGCDIRIFQKWPCAKKIILPHTHRLPKKIYTLARRVVENIETRSGNDYECSPAKEKEEGVLDTIASLDEIEGKIKVGANMIMCARSANKWHPFVRYLKERGLVWKQKGNDTHGKKFISSVKDSVIKAVENWRLLQQGGGLKAKAVQSLMSCFKENLITYGKKGALIDTNLCPETFKNPDNTFTFQELQKKYHVLADIHKDWFDVCKFTCDRIKTHKKPNALYDSTEDYNNYLKMAYELDPTFTKTDILVSTIHSVKGMERDIVVMNIIWTWPSWKNYLAGTPQQIDEELRVAYVAITRAKHELYLYEPMKATKTENYFPFGDL